MKVTQLQNQNLLLETIKLLLAKMIPDMLWYLLEI